MDSASESKLISLMSQLLLLHSNSKIMPQVIQIISFVRSMDLDALQKPESKLMALVSQAISLFKSTDMDSLPEPLSKLISIISKKASSNSDQMSESDLNFWSLLEETLKLKPYPELISLIFLIFSIVISTNTELKLLTSVYGQVQGYFDEGKFRVTHDGSPDLELKLVSLISELLLVVQTRDPIYGWDLSRQLKLIPLVIQIIYVVRYMDLDSLPKPESNLMSLVSQAISFFNSMDINSLPEPLSKLISLISQNVSKDSDHKPLFKLISLISQKVSRDSDQKSVMIFSSNDPLDSDLKFRSLVEKILELKPDHEIISLIREIVSVVAISMNSELETFTFLCPQVQGNFEAGGKFSVHGKELKWSGQLWKCFLGIVDKFRFQGEGEEDITYFRCSSCNGEYHNEYERALVEIKHPLHRKHSLQLVLNTGSHKTRECYCCDDDLEKVFYICLACDFAMNVACVEKPRVLSIPLSKWHEHPLALFPRKTSLTCDICALATSNSAFYICPPCDFVAHLKCINLPRVIKISRHPYHRLCHTPSFEERDGSCGVCRRKIDNDYGGYSCVKDGCSYAAHSRCATQRNVWDGTDLDGEPEEIEEEVAEPFVRISNGIIQHFSHDHHHLRLDENTCRDYDDKKLCQACITPIYFGNFYSCLQCEFVLHETCAYLSRKLYHPIHPHLLTLAIVRYGINFKDGCAACDRLLSTAGFFYECGKKGCDFNLHLQCATISEPLVHSSHVHQLFLTSKPGEIKSCSVCRKSNETFNCIDECNDDFALCFRCATLPQKLRYKHDKHILTLSYGEETDTVTYWCEACEGKINLKKGFYMCDEYCCVTLHIGCLIGKDLYMKPGSSITYDIDSDTIDIICVQSNNHHMSRPICSRCKKRCLDKLVFQCYGIYCSLNCITLDIEDYQSWLLF